MANDANGRPREMAGKPYNKRKLDNFEIARWPTGNPETGYLDCDGGPVEELRNN